MGLGSDLELLDFRVGVPYVFWLLTSHGEDKGRNLGRRKEHLHQGVSFHFKR